MLSLPPKPFTVSESVASAWSIVTWAERPVTEIGAADQRDIDRVVAAAAVDGDAVELAVGGGAAGRRQVDRHQLDVGAGEVVDDDVVDAALAS